MKYTLLALSLLCASSFMICAAGNSDYKNTNERTHTKSCENCSDDKCTGGCKEASGCCHGK